MDNYIGAISGMLGFGGGAAGTSFAGPQAANITDLSNTQQIDTAYGQNQQALQGQGQLLAALQGQNGLGNQSQVYGQLQGIASGQVNPAQAQFAQNTAANVAQQGALQAGQRGAAQNVGLMARNAGQQGAAIQQQAAGQEATQQAQNQIAAIGAAGQMANQQAGQQIGQVNQNVGAQQAEQSNLLNALAQQNSAKVSSQGSINAANAGLASQQMQGTQGMIGGLMNAAGMGAKVAGGKAHGGMLMADGGAVPQKPQGPQSFFAKWLSGVSAPSGYGSQNEIMQSKPMQNIGVNEAKKDSGPLELQNTQELPASTMMDTPIANKGGMVDVVVSPGEKIVPPSEVQKVAQGGTAKMKTVPGKAKVDGDSTQNDTVPAKLPAGTVVVKRTRANNNPEGFIKEVLSKRKGGK